MARSPKSRQMSFDQKSVFGDDLFGSGFGSRGIRREEVTQKSYRQRGLLDALPSIEQPKVEVFDLNRFVDERHISPEQKKRMSHRPLF